MSDCHNRGCCRCIGGAGKHQLLVVWPESCARRLPELGGKGLALVSS